MKRPIDIPPFLVMEILERAQELERQGRDIIHLEVGEPDFPTPDCIKEAAYRALRDGETHYSASVGILPLREAVCEYFHSRYGVGIMPDRIVITSGTSPGILLALSSMLGEGDEVILPNPHYACYPQFINYVGGSPVFVDAREATGFELEPEAVRERVGPRTRAIMINSPANPTGHVMDAGVIREPGPEWRPPGFWMPPSSARSRRSGRSSSPTKYITGSSTRGKSIRRSNTLITRSCSTGSRSSTR